MTDNAHLNTIGCNSQKPQRIRASRIYFVILHVLTACLICIILYTNCNTDPVLPDTISKIIIIPDQVNKTNQQIYTIEDSSITQHYTDAINRSIQFTTTSQTHKYIGEIYFVCNNGRCIHGFIYSNWKLVRINGVYYELDLGILHSKLSTYHPLQPWFFEISK